MFVHPRQADEIAARFSEVTRWQFVVTREGHQDGLEFQVELAPGASAEQVSARMVEAIRDVMKLRGTTRVVPPGTIPPSARKIDDRRKWD
jgi:phenylacetate-CoA ligase